MDRELKTLAITITDGSELQLPPGRYIVAATVDVVRGGCRLGLTATRVGEAGGTLPRFDELTRRRMWRSRARAWLQRVLGSSDS